MFHFEYKDPPHVPTYPEEVWIKIKPNRGRKK
jgi:hypothetical protein